ncbi:MAG: lipoate--protein ligase family protein [Comamonadaceae bacterium]
MKWLTQALEGQSTAVVWRAQPGLVAPLSYRRYANLAEVSAASMAQGWPIRLRRSGGGVVPQGPGILNLSLAYPCQGAPGAMAESVYAHLCGVLSRALATLDIACGPGLVTDSFCDGRFNLAVPAQGKLRKIAGTAQYWRRTNGYQAVLAHALLLVDADPELLSAQANRFEAALASGLHYEAKTLTSVALCWSASHPGRAIPTDLSSTVAQQIAASLSH